MRMALSTPASGPGAICRHRARANRFSAVLYSASDLSNASNLRCPPSCVISTPGTSLGTPPGYAAT